jgi:glycosidase
MTELKGDVAKAKVAATLLLTLPGFPFVYYGEEIGMTGDKPDERLRTPMQWNGSSRGFSSGTPWETLQSDTLTTNVAGEDRQQNSLLNLYRKLIHLRARNRALREGSLEPVESGSESVLAYTRRRDSSLVLVLVNLGSNTVPAPAIGVRISDGAICWSKGTRAARHCRGSLRGEHTSTNC